MNEHVDVLVIGGGPAGIAASCSAAECGARTVLLDEAPRPGGQIWRHTAPAALPAVARDWLQRLRRATIRVVNGATVIDAERSDDEWHVLAERAGKPLRIGARRIIVCTGARERFLPCPGWTLPGVVGIGGLQALLKSGLTVTGRRVVIAGSGPLLLPVAATAAKAGARVILVAEQAPARRVRAFGASLWHSPSKLLAAARYRTAFMRTPYRLGEWVTHAHGDTSVRAVDVTSVTGTRRVDCDILATGYGLVPALELPRLLGCDISDGRVVVDDLQRTTAAEVYCAGEGTGIAGVDASLIEGQIAGRAAADADARSRFHERDRQRAFADRLEHAFALRDELRRLAADDTIVCRCEDVRYGAVAHCGSARDAKLFTRAGMGPCQGRVCGAALGFLFGWPPDTVRPPVAAALIGTLASAGVDEA